MKPANLLRWYPRAWRERYGEELLILVQDNLGEGRPAWPLRLSVIWGGLGERGRQARHAAAAWFKRPVWSDRWGTILMAGLVSAFLPVASHRRRRRREHGRRWPWMRCWRPSP